ncbi:MAG: metal-dependent hydrolase [Acidobacteriota bacterium]
MDTITHGFLGAAVAQAAFGKRLPRGAALIGAVGAMLPDADIFIYSFNDPTVGWLFHRHFTHALAFIPIGGLIAALPFLFLKRFKDYKPWVILAAIISYATHGALDMLTSYGTQLFRPFSDTRVALDWIGIVDPVYSLPLVVGVYLTARTGRSRAARVALLVTTLYICFGGWQHHRGVDAQTQLAAMRGHQIGHFRVMPAPGWLVMWRSVYTANGQLYADGLRLNWFGAPRVLEGGSADLTTFDDLPVVAQTNAETRRRFAIFHWFAEGLIAPVAAETSAYGDERITFEVESLTPMWGLKIDEATGEARGWNPTGPRRNIGRALRTLVVGDARYRTLEEIKQAR